MQVITECPSCQNTEPKRLPTATWRDGVTDWQHRYARQIPTTCRSVAHYPDMPAVGLPRLPAILTTIIMIC